MTRSIFLSASFFALLAACDGSPTDAAPEPIPEPAPPIASCELPTNNRSRVSEAEAPFALDSLFRAAEREFGVPAPLLAAIGYAETRWQMVIGRPEHPGQPTVHGLMGLKGEQLGRGAVLAGVSAAEARTKPAANVRTAAALLRSYAEEEGIPSPDLGAWAAAVARYGLIEHPEGRASYVHDAVYAILRSGTDGSSGARGASYHLAARDVHPRFPLPTASLATAPTDFPSAVWRASPNFNGRPGGDIGRVTMVILHSCEGNYTGCWSWLANPASQVSAHYVIDEDGSEVSQLVREADRAWHIGSRYDCDLNAGWECWRNGESNNHFTVGIEHAGFAAQTRWPDSQIDASARLVCDVTRRHGIAPDGLHILAHGQLQPHNRTDPGPHWPWTEYLARIRTHCGDVADQVIIDSNNRFNSSDVAEMRTSGSWTAADEARGFWGTGYYWAPTSVDDDRASFRFFLPDGGTRTVEAWWTSGTNRSSSATFVAMSPDGRTLGRNEADQQRYGGRWNTLGTWTFPAGWNSVDVLRTGAPGCVVIADAVRVR